MYRPKMLHSLLNLGACPNLKLDRGRSLMHLYLYLTEMETAKKLISAGGSLHAKDLFCRTPLHYLILNDPFNMEVFKLVWESIRDTDLREARDKWGLTPLLTSVVHRRYIAFETMLRDGADVTALDNMGDNILHLAIMHKAVPIIPTILKLSEVSLEHKNNYGKTPIICAFNEENRHLEKMLKDSIHLK